MVARKGDGLRWTNKDGWCTRTMVTIDGEKVRKMVPLGTRDRVVARRKLARFQAGEAPPMEDVAAPITVREAMTHSFARWVADGIVEADQRRSRIERYALPHIGDMNASDVKGSDVTEILYAAKRTGLKRESLKHIRSGLSSVFDDLWRDEVILENPVLKARMPKMREVQRARAILTDDELSALLSSPVADLEIKMLVLMSRTIGGMRAGDLNNLEWSAFNDDFSICRVPRKKTGTPQPLEVPVAARPFVARWHELLKKPAAGPVFPVRRGARAGHAKRAGNMSYAKRLRRELKRALGVTVHDGKRWVEKPQEEWTRRWVELFTETPTTRPVDFHSTRRAFATALARANINSQTAQILSGHSGSEVHQRYVANTITALPDGAIPSLPSELVLSVPSLPPKVGCATTETTVETTTSGISSVGRASASQSRGAPPAKRNAAQSLRAQFRDAAIRRGVTPDNGQRYQFLCHSATWSTESVLALIDLAANWDHQAAKSLAEAA